MSEATEPESSQTTDPSEASASTEADLPRAGIMSFGDHLEELRTRLIRALLGIALATVISLIFAKRILAFILRPVLVVQLSHGQPAQAQALSPPDAFLTYLKMSILCGLIISMPWVLMQIWRFVSIGLYRREQRYVRMFAPASVLLFAAGVAFMYFVVLPIVLNFFVSFGEKIEVTDLKPNFLQKYLMAGDASTNGAEAPPLEAGIPTLKTDPENPPVGSTWINSTRSLFCVQTEHGVFSVPMQRVDRAPAVKSQFGLNYYISFVLALSFAFGLAFELPLVVLFMTTAHIVSVSDLVKYRRHVIVGVFLAAAFLTPPDVISQLLLAIPMVFLFEGALLVSRVAVGRQEEQVAAG